MFTLFKFIVGKLAIGGHAAALVALQLSSAAIQTNQVSQEVETNRQTIAQHQEQSQAQDTALVNADFIAETDNGFRIDNENFEQVDLDAPLVKISEGAVLDINRSPAAIEIAEMQNPYQKLPTTPALQAPTAGTTLASDSSSSAPSEPSVALTSPAVIKKAESSPKAEAPGRAIGMLAMSKSQAPVAKTATVAASTLRVVSGGSSHTSSNSTTGGSSGGTTTGGTSGGAPAEYPELINAQSESYSHNLNEVGQITVSGLNNQAGHLYLATVTYKDSANYLSQFSNFGNLTWSKVSTQCSNYGDFATEVWWAIGNGSGDTNLSIELHGTTKIFQAVITQWDKINPNDPVELLNSGNTLGMDGAASCGGANTQASTLNYSISTIEDNSVILVSTGFHKAQADYTPVDMTEIIQIDGGVGALGLNTQLAQKDMPTAGSFTVEGSFSLPVMWSGVAIEIKPLP